MLRAVRWCIFWAILANVCSVEQFVAFNKHWVCNGCSDFGYDTEQANKIFGIIRAAIMHDQRNAYFGLDSSWMDNVILPESKVVVTVARPSTLKSLVMDPPRTLPKTEYEERYQVLYSEVSSIRHRDVDEFLTHNPCWLPLHEPTISNSSRYNYAPKYGDEEIDPQRHPFIKANYGTYQSAVVLLRLPVYGFHATCRLFSELTRIQFPAQCHYDPDHAITYKLRNIGWSSVFDVTMHNFAEILNPKNYPNKVFMVPGAQIFKSRTRTWTDRNGSSFTDRGGWYWSDSASCPPKIEDYDPWACNFISITNCTRYEAGVSLLDPPYPPVDEKEHVFYLFKDYYLAPDKPSDADSKLFFVVQDSLSKKGFDQESGPHSPSIFDLRNLYSDAVLEGEEQWVRPSPGS